MEDLEHMLPADKPSIRRIIGDGAELTYGEFVEQWTKIGHGSTALDAALHLVAHPDMFLSVGPREAYEAIDVGLLRTQITLAERSRCGWDNPITAYPNLVWIVESFGLNPSTKSFGLCFSCGKKLEDEGIILSFGNEGPWSFCRSCVLAASEAFGFIGTADW